MSKNIACALQILKDKGYIDYYMYKTKSNLKRIPEYSLTVEKGDKLFGRICNMFVDSDEYKHGSVDRYHKTLNFFNIKEVRNWLDATCKEEETRVIGANGYMERWINHCTNYEHTSDSGGYLIINRKVRAERIALEKSEEQEAIDLLEKIL